MNGWGRSIWEQWPKIVSIFERSPWPHEKIVDVGAGHGLAAPLLRSFLNRPPRVMVALEPNPGYHGFLGHYDAVYDLTADRMSEAWWGRYSSVLMADVLEHMPHDLGATIIDRIPGEIVISTPLDALSMDNEGVPPLEQHVSQWTVAEFSMTGRLEARHEIAGQMLIHLRPQGA